MSCHAHALAASRRFLVAEDVDLIGEAAAMLPLGRHVTVVDLGAGSGTTALSVFAKRSRDITVCTVDISEVALESTAQCMTNAGYRAMWEGFQCESSYELKVRSNPRYPWVKETHRCEPVDLLLIDADHGYEAVCADLDAWLPYMPHGAPVWIHDYTAEYPGSIQAVDEAVEAGVLLPLKTAGWGWLGRKA